MAIRFTSYDWYKQLLASSDGNVSGEATFFGEDCCFSSTSIFYELTIAPIVQPDSLPALPKQSLS